MQHHDPLITMDQGTAMTPELTYLVLSAILAFVQVMVAATAATSQIGVRANAGNRDNIPRFEGFCGRAYRAHSNMLENLILFAIIVLSANAAGISTAMTVLGVQIFFFARLVYAIVYWLGIPWVRSIVWLVSVIGMALIATELLSRAVF